MEIYMKISGYLRNIMKLCTANFNSMVTRFLRKLQILAIKFGWGIDTLLEF